MQRHAAKGVMWCDPTNEAAEDGDDESDDFSEMERYLHSLNESAGPPAYCKWVRPRLGVDECGETISVDIMEFMTAAAAACFFLRRSTPNVQQDMELVRRTVRQFSLAAYWARSATFDGWPMDVGPLCVDRYELASHGFAYNGER
jgi:hypothetical protein